MAKQTELELRLLKFPNISINKKKLLQATAECVELGTGDRLQATFYGHHVGVIQSWPAGTMCRVEGKAKKRRDDDRRVFEVGRICSVNSGQPSPEGDRPLDFPRGKMKVIQSHQSGRTHSFAA